MAALQGFAARLRSEGAVAGVRKRQAREPKRRSRRLASLHEALQSWLLKGAPQHYKRRCSASSEKRKPTGSGCRLAPSRSILTAVAVGNRSPIRQLSAPRDGRRGRQQDAMSKTRARKVANDPSSQDGTLAPDDIAGHDPTQSGVAAVIDWSVRTSCWSSWAPWRYHRRLAGDQADATRCHPGPDRYAGHHPHGIRWAVPADRRGSRHLSAFDDVARPAADEGRARLLDVRHQFRLCHVSGWRRPVLGAVARGRGAVEARWNLPANAPANRAGCHRRRLGLPVRADRPQR